MLLFLSDVHLGRGSPAERRASERAVVALLEHHAEELRAPEGGLLLLGDLFNAWMEYGATVPRPPVRLLGALARLVDAGVPVTYVAGNRDLWHLGFFQDEIGLAVTHEAVRRPIFGRTLYAAHGDGLVPTERAYNRLRPVLRSRLAYTLYRWAFPADLGFRLARRIAARGTGAPEEPIVDGLRVAARRALTDAPADLAVLGHGHRAELTPFPEGLYLNSGYWHAERTYGTAAAEGVRLMRWLDASARAEPLAEAPWPHLRTASTEGVPDLGNNPAARSVSRHTP